MRDASEIPVRCSAFWRDGQPCGAKPLADGLCYAHGPHAQEWHRQGGAATSTGNRAQRLLPARLRPLVDLLERAVKEAYDGTLKSEQAQLIAPLSRALIAAFTAGQVEERLRDVEQAAKAADAQRAEWALLASGERHVSTGYRNGWADGRDP